MTIDVRSGGEVGMAGEVGAQFAGLAAELAAIELSGRVTEIVGRLNMAFAELVGVVAEVEASGAWAGVGIRSVEHWLAWQAGVSAATARQLHRVAAALDTHPLTTGLFLAGQLTLDQAAAAVDVLACHDAELAALAPAATVAQIRIAARGSRPPRPPTGDDDTPAGGAGRGGAGRRESVSFGSDDDGWLHGEFHFAPDRAGTFRNAMDETRQRLFAAGATSLSWADVLIEILEQSLDAQPPARARRYDSYLFIDPTRPLPGSWIDGVTVNTGLQHLFTCDGWIHPVIVDGATPVGVGRAQRSIPEHTRRLIHHRDHGVCQVPWCNRSQGLEVHHIVHWRHGGPTETWNLILICRHCHRAIHLDEFHIVGNADHPESLQFLNPSGHPITRPIPDPNPATAWARPVTPYQHPTGEHADWRFYDLPPPPD